MTILMTVIVITSIATVLALLLTLANTYIANYGQCKITINNEKEITVEGGNSLLSSLRDSQIFIPSACGGKGSCAYCKVTVTEGGGPVLPTELPYLSERELKNNVRLSCQCKVKENMKIEIPEELFNVKEFRTLVEKIINLTPTIKLLRLKLIDPDQISFKPGQYIQLKAPIYEGSKEEVYRAYSLASSVHQPNRIELIIGYVPNGICTTYVHKYLKEGDEVLLNGPYGEFYLRNSEREIILVAVGTGMAPMRSILYQMAEQNITRKATYFFGARTKTDLILIEEMKAFEEKIPNFTFFPCLSRPAPEDQWTGDVGRVTDLIEKYVENGGNKEAYLCGSKTMIESTVEVLKKKGIPEDLIYYDKFD
ncbi:NADH:ubiquinone reductase (Na(+)-transporting) subunit F [Thermotalea metallivorans]|uniref:Na(+)-translocating NADH-quinone reductase subunit F n=1 Tax=Thermotalea metallivorans TaxID=520762 RepID=A0A140LB41_9FIRM|nr:2Fe-2S iron-sulfur cluster binding domain-containing protein [Thermotalea metallivorans]KXG77766.1 Na(+)-translocating NADH-quinone reductase subunit F [Thermotalea metallivorans]